MGKAKKYLKGIKWYRQRIIELHQHQEELRKVLTPSGISYDTDRVQTTPGDRMASIFCNIMEKENAIKKCRKAIDNIHKQILLLDNEKHRTTLEMVYMYGFTIKDTANRMGYSYVQMKRLHSEALEEFERKYLNG